MTPLLSKLRAQAKEYWIVKAGFTLAHPTLRQAEAHANRQNKQPTPIHVISAEYCARLEELVKAAEGLERALKYYAPRKCWAEFIVNGEMLGCADGDFMDAFNNPEKNGPENGDTAREALSEWQAALKKAGAE